jgi:hypothetical protein
MIVIGYLVPFKSGWTVRCPQCEVNRQGPDWMHKLGTQVRIFHDNIYPYNQDCGFCQRTLVKGREGWPQLFSGK